MGRGIQGLPSVGHGWFSSGVCADLESESEARPNFPKLMVSPYAISFFRRRFFKEFGLIETKMYAILRRALTSKSHDKFPY